MLPVLARGTNCLNDSANYFPFQHIICLVHWRQIYDITPFLAWIKSTKVKKRFRLNNDFWKCLPKRWKETGFFSPRPTMRLFRFQQNLHLLTFSFLSKDQGRAQAHADRKYFSSFFPLLFRWQKMQISEKRFMPIATQNLGNLVFFLQYEVQCFVPWEELCWSVSL